VDFLLPPDDDPLTRGEGAHKVNGMGTGIVIDERGYILPGLGDVGDRMYGTR